MVEHQLRESLATSCLTQLAVETERLGNGQVGLDGVHGGTRSLLLGEDHTTLSVEGRVDTTESGLGALGLDHENGLLETRVGEEGGSVDDTAGGTAETNQCMIGQHMCRGTYGII